MGAAQGRTCELAWLVPWRRGGGLFVGESPPDSSERRLTAHSADEVIAHVRRIGREVCEEFGAYPSVSLQGLADPDLSAAAVGDRWHFWYLAENGGVYRRSVGDESEAGSTRMILNDFEDIPNAELVPAAAGEAVIREWFEHKRLSKAIGWREH
jgi:hypothetical protein